ncbi:MAG: adhesin transport system membrane fusion protein [Verrucomicrobiales bacterium]|jgi:adhesin transport system membrane fusion protein
MTERPLYPEELDFARNARSALLRDRVTGANLLLWLIAAIIGGFIYWASEAELDEVTKGAGKVIPSASVQTVQNLEGGIIAEMLVSEGDRVLTGDVLARIDDTLSNASYQENLTQVDALVALLSRLQAEGEGRGEIEFPDDMRPDLIERETALFDKRQDDLAEQTKTLSNSHRLALDELTMTVPLVERNIVSKVDQMRLEREVSELDGKITEITAKFQSEAMALYNETKGKIESLEQTLTGRQDRVRRTVVRSPVDGIVNHVHATTTGGVVQPGEPIVDIVPDDESVLVEAKIRPSDIAFLHPGQTATLKFTAYDFAMYGGLEGVVEHISADTIEDEIDHEHYYQIKVRKKAGELKTKDGKTLPIIPGMVAEVDVLTGRRTVLQYLLKPFHRVRHNALRER